MPDKTNYSQHSIAIDGFGITSGALTGYEALLSLRIPGL
jgi:hypothetical protein